MASPEFAKLWVGQTAGQGGEVGHVSRSCAAAEAVSLDIRAAAAPVPPDLRGEGVATHEAPMDGHGGPGIARRNAGATSAWNSSSAARCSRGVRPSRSADRCVTQWPNCSW
ncbi:hypothetical protein SAMN05421854_103577 [Amycolatopsis rubida]|uniref:Uncharacterized protein n=1 Tax=Amycolatopsis rubida TaxID=112413 RepID=A0A1I5LG44_9PSEU|nr:hypothetical protein SAMN05421854_103577 [Amycolatopsis rubida]